MERYKISEAELEVMKVLWEENPLTSKEIIKRLHHMAWSDNTIKTFLNRLLNKGSIKYKAEGRTYLYSPTISYDKYLSKENKNFLNVIYNGATNLLISKFIEEEELSDEDIKELQDMLENKRKE